MARNWAPLLESSDWKDRLKGEIMFLSDKYEKLGHMLERYARHELSFQPKCSFELLVEQHNAMGSYLNILLLRAVIEGVQVEDDK